MTQAATVHEPTAKHLREIVKGPVVVWDVPPGHDPARALAIADVLNTWWRTDVFTVVLVSDPDDSELVVALRQFASGLNLTRSWIIGVPQAGQREALAERAVVWLTDVPGPQRSSVASIAEALATMLGERAA
jgi:hypothetical protein